MEDKSLLNRYIQITLVVTGYWVVSIATVFVNKALFSSERIDLEAPLFVTWFQCICSVLICLGIKFLSTVFPEKCYFPPGSPWSYHLFKNVFPVAILFTAMIAFNNLCLKYVDVTFYYIGRSLTTVFNVILSYILLGQTTSWKAVVCCCVIVAGFWIGIDQESMAGSLSLMGVTFGLLGSIALPLYSIQTKHVLPAINQEIWLLSYCNNVYSSILLIPVIYTSREVESVFNYQGITDSYFWFLMSIGGICGFAIGFFTSLEIKVTSPLTHNVSGTAKSCLQTVLATQFFHEYKSPLWWLSNFTVLGGSFAYTLVKQQEMKKELKKHTSTRQF